MIRSGSGMDGSLGVIEILNRSGQVLQRVAYEGGHIRIGRAYDNDIIVGDPYVCPHHLELSFEADRAVLRDVGSVNGSFVGRSNKRLSQIELTDTQLVQFGHSQLRFRSAHTQVPPAWKDISRRGLLSMFDKPWMVLIAAALAITVLFLDSLLETAENLSIGELASAQFYPVMGILIWSGLWSMVNRVTAHRANLHVHLSIACTGLALYFAGSQLISLAGFAWALDALVGPAALLFRILLITAVIVIHLRYATHSNGRSRIIASGMAALLLFGVPALGDYLQRREFSTIPFLQPLLRPPIFQVSQGVDAKTFFQDSAALRIELEREKDSEKESGVSDRSSP